MIYDEDNDIFIPKKPYASWVLIQQKQDGNHQLVMLQNYLKKEQNTHRYEWNEATGAWDKVAGNI